MVFTVFALPGGPDACQITVNEKNGVPTGEKDLPNGASNYWVMLEPNQTFWNFGVCAGGFSLTDFL